MEVVEKGNVIRIYNEEYDDPIFKDDKKNKKNNIGLCST